MLDGLLLLQRHEAGPAAGAAPVLSDQMLGCLLFDLLEAGVCNQGQNPQTTCLPLSSDH